MPSVDVAIPNYNYGRYLRECVESVLTQNGVDLRVLIIDNASTDNSVEIAQELASQDKRIEIVARKKNLGPNASWNESIDWASSDYFIIVCSDDLLTSGALGRAVSIMDAHPQVSFSYGVGMVYFGATAAPVIPPQEKTTWEITTGEAFIRARCRAPDTPLAAGTAVVRTPAQKAAGYYRSSLTYTDDMEMLLRLATQGAVARTKATQQIVRHHGSNISQGLWGKRLRDLQEHKAAYDSFFSHEGHEVANSALLHRMVKQGLGKQAYWTGVSQLVRGNFQLSRNAFAFAFACNPKSIIFPPIRQLFRTKNLLQRASDAMSETFRTKIKHK